MKEKTDIRNSGRLRHGAAVPVVMALALILAAASPAVPAFAGVLKGSSSARTSGSAAGEADRTQQSSAAGPASSGGSGTSALPAAEAAAAAAAAQSEAGVVVESPGAVIAESAGTGSVQATSASVGAVAGQQSVAESSAIVDVTPPSGATGTVGSARSSGPKIITTSLFDGGELMMLSPDSASQMMSFLITTKSGKLIMVDGGTENETEHLKEVLLERGGHVSAWLITHPHSDHVGAFTRLLQDPASGITIDAVYYNFAPIEWYHANEEYRAQMVEDCLAALSTLSPSVNHPNIHSGDTFSVDDVTIRVMNEPYLFQTNAINNSSVAFRVELNGKRILFLGDMGIPAGNSFLNEYQGRLHELKADIVEMAHHGEQGVDHNVYEAVQPSICLWCCPEWLWNNDNGGGMNSGPWKTLEVRGWMRQLGVKTHVVEKDGDQVLR